MIDNAETAAPLTVSPERAAHMLDLGRTKVFALLAEGELPHMKVGRRTLIPVPAHRMTREMRSPAIRDPSTYGPRRRVERDRHDQCLIGESDRGKTMKRIAVGLAVLLVSVAVFAQPSLNVWIKVSPIVATNGIVAGTTNLPDGTVLSVALAGPDYSAFNRDNCCFDAVVAVSHGAFGPVKIIKDGVDPKPGSYRVTVMMRDESMQPANVLAVIGKQGENLRGLLVVGPSDDRGVETTIPVEVQ